MSVLMSIHVSTGLVAVLAGSVALIVRKGHKLHRRAGNIFFGSMLLMASTGMVIAWLKPMMITLIAGAFTAYLVSTSWVTIKRKTAEINWFDYTAFIAALMIGLVGLKFGLDASNSESGLKDGFSAEPYFFFCFLAWLSAALDLNLIIRKGMVGAHRLARHLWRMCFALYIAMGSLFTGPGASAFPESIRGTFILTVPENAVALLMFFWLARVFWKKGKRPGQQPS
jgi:hypothetical protein